MASSPLTERYDLAESALNRGIDVIVIKSSADFERKCSRDCWGSCQAQKRTIALDVITTSDGRIYPVEWPEEGMHNVYSTSTYPLCDLLTIEESNQIFRRIKAAYPSAIVVANYAPADKRGFDRVDYLEGDVIEFSSRNYDVNYPRPLIMMEWVENIVLQDIFDSSLRSSQDTAFIERRHRALDDFGDALSRVTRPKMFKAVPWPELEFLEQFDLPVDGFTVADSSKRNYFRSRGGVAQNVWGKGSDSGQHLFECRKALVRNIRERYPSTFIAASGGVFSKDDAQQMLDAGADIVQLCSVVFHKGFGCLKEFEGLPARQ
jgi:hypothetical protein